MAMPYDDDAFGGRNVDLLAPGRADTLLSRDERNELIALLARNPVVGELIPGLGGIRKMRFAAGGKGKRGGFRVIWYVATTAQPVLALLIYGKNEQANPTPDQRRAMLAAIERMQRAATTHKG